jgi:hypothetical protein
MPLLQIVFLVGVVMLAAAPVPVAAQTPPYGDRVSRGRDVTPAYEGYRRNPDGTYTMYFGYMNRNYEEELDIPVGPDNHVDPGGDRGQPTHFYPRRNSFLFTVVVPKDWGLERKVVWTLTMRGKTNQARGWLQPEWEINDEIVMMNSGGGADLENKPPVITGAGSQSVTLPNAVALTATAQDDGRPKRQRVTLDPEAVGAAAQGVSVRWIHYRGPAGVRFGPGASASGYDKPVTAATRASFKAPGVYVLRAVASDGSLEAFHDVTVTVK